MVESSRGNVPSLALESILKESHEDEYCKNSPKVQGNDFKGSLDDGKLLASYSLSGIQPKNLSRAVEIINVMLNERKQELKQEPDVDDEFIQRRSGCTIFVGYSSRGLRDMIRFLVQHSLIDCIAMTSNRIEEDLIKCLPNIQEDAFRGWMLPILDKMLVEQNNSTSTIWTPSRMIERLGLEINNKDSVCFWAAKNKIPIFCPSLTGGIRKVITFHRSINPGLKIINIKDITRLAKVAWRAKKSGVVILGSGMCKHHVLNANLMRGGADFAVFVNTANEFDASDAGASPDEAKSWGKLKADAMEVKVHCDPALAFPSIFAQTFEKLYMDEVFSGGNHKSYALELLHKESPEDDRSIGEKIFSNDDYEAGNYRLAIKITNVILNERQQEFKPQHEVDDEFVRRRSGCTIFLGYTSNMISSGLRETIRFLVRHSLVDCIVSTAGGIEEDLIKCLPRLSDKNKTCDTFLGDFTLSGSMLRDIGINRIGNLLVPNQNYCAFEDWILPIFDKMLEEQKKSSINWTPSKLIERLGFEINNENSVCFWAAKNKIPIFCPALTDGSIGDMMVFHSFRNPEFDFDIAEDFTRLDKVALNAKKSAIIMLGGGESRNLLLDANLMRGGADYSIFVDTSSKYDEGEVNYWSKVKNTRAVKVCAEAGIVFPLLVYRTFYKFHTEITNKNESK